MRERKKRGKASRKDLAQQAAAAAANGRNSPPGQSSSTASDSRFEKQSLTASVNNEDAHPSDTLSTSFHKNVVDKATDRRQVMKRYRARSFGNVSDTQYQHHHLISGHEEAVQQDSVESPASLGSGEYGAMQHNPIRPFINQEHVMAGMGSTNCGVTGLPVYSEMPYSILSPPNYSDASQSPSGAFRMINGAHAGFILDSQAQRVQSPGWMNLSPPNTQSQTSNFSYQSRYPVLQPLIPHLGNIISVSLACDLLDLYFASSSSAQMHPMSPYVLGYCFRKTSFLHPTQPRLCTPALLASVLWVAAQTSEAAHLAPPATRGRVCQRLLELTVGLLKPLIHSPQAGETHDFSDTVINGVALGGLGVAMSGTVGLEKMNGGDGAFGAAGALDDVVTYIHLATVVSASEYKGASLRWWNAAWSLARELKLGRELPLSPASQPLGQDHDADGDTDDNMGQPSHSGSVSPNSMTEEALEERRRIWWLVYTVDRHLSLCYNKPLFLLDAECDGLLQPMDDKMWQAGETYSGDSSIHITSPNGSAHIRRRGPNFECTGHSIFGYFTPLMTILGEIVDLNHAKNHPRFGVGCRSMQEWNEHEREITSQLEAYERSLKAFEVKNLFPAAQTQDSNSQLGSVAGHSNPDDFASSPFSATSRATTESDIQTRIVVAYGTHVMHVLHILLTGKWDPITLFDDNDLWISSQSFIDATGHAVSAAEAIEKILEYDPGLEFMPFFFGVYLLQGSFLLLLIADKLETEASPSVVKACETIVRAHEACVVTLNTEYQVCCHYQEILDPSTY